MLSSASIVATCDYDFSGLPDECFLFLWLVILLTVTAFYRFISMSLFPNLLLFNLHIWIWNKPQHYWLDLMSLVGNTVPTYCDVIEEEIRPLWLHIANMYSLTGIVIAQIDQLQDKIKCSIPVAQNFSSWYCVQPPLWYLHRNFSVYMAHDVISTDLIINDVSGEFTTLLYTISLSLRYSLTSVCWMTSDDVTGSVHVMDILLLLVTFIIIIDGLSKYEMNMTKINFLKIFFLKLNWVTLWK
jgi:hypothetical protein